MDAQMAEGFSVTAQRQLFGGKRGGSSGTGQRVSFRDSFGQNQNPYRWVASEQQQQQPGRVGQTTQQMSAADIVKGLATEISGTWEGGHMWPFSCLGFDKDMPSLPGFMDISPEEMRLDAYEALKSGNIQPYVQKVEGAYNQLNSQRQELKNPSMNLKQKLISFIDDCRRKKSSGATGHVSLFSESSSSSNIFGNGDSGGLFGTSSNQTNSGPFGTSSAFGQTGAQSIFGQTGTQSGFGQSGAHPLFGQSETQTQSPFSQTVAKQPTDSQSLFGQPSFTQSTQPNTIFGQTLPGTEQTTTIFGQPVSQTSAFGQETPQTPTANLFGNNTFGTPQTSGASSGNAFQTSTPFGQSSASARNLFGGHTVTVVPPEPTFAQPAPQENRPVQESQSVEVSSVYTPIDKLTAQELQQFQAPTFTLGSIPTKPPPRELCF